MSESSQLLHQPIMPLSKVPSHSPRPHSGPEADRFSTLDIDIASPLQDIPASRPSSGHRLSLGSPANGLPGRSAVARPHAHSVSLGTSLNPAHRVSRRKSSFNMGGVNMTALKDSLESGRAAHSPALSRSPYASGASYMAANAQARPTTGSSSHASSALVDGPPLSATDRSSAKARARRASEGGSRLSKAERRRSTAGELKCEMCGKGYKHGSCLTKHMWEHTPEWALTSKLLISKHQQVQLLEAASVLVAMNKDAPEDSAVLNDSDMSADSPAASGSSDLHEDDAATSSSRTSTPSVPDDTASAHTFKRQPRRQDSYSSGLSRSYQSTAATSYAASSLPADGPDMYYRQWQGHHARPSTSSSGMGYYEREDQSDIAAAAAGLLSCSLGTPKQQAHMMPDVPPVPALPAKYVDQAQHYRNNTSHDVTMEYGTYSHVRGRSEEDDDGVFGRMEQ